MTLMYFLLPFQLKVGTTFITDCCPNSVVRAVAVSPAEVSQPMHTAPYYYEISDYCLCQRIHFKPVLLLLLLLLLLFMQLMMRHFS